VAVQVVVEAVPFGVARVAAVEQAVVAHVADPVAAVQVAAAAGQAAVVHAADPVAVVQLVVEHVVDPFAVEQAVAAVARFAVVRAADPAVVAQRDSLGPDQPAVYPSAGPGYHWPADYSQPL